MELRGGGRAGLGLELGLGLGAPRVLRAPPPCSRRWCPQRRAMRLMGSVGSSAGSAIPPRRAPCPASRSRTAVPGEPPPPPQGSGQRGSPGGLGSGPVYLGGTGSLGDRAGSTRGWIAHGSPGRPAAIRCHVQGVRGQGERTCRGRDRLCGSGVLRPLQSNPGSNHPRPGSFGSPSRGWFGMAPTSSGVLDELQPIV